jgi:hypothetical protein
VSNVRSWLGASRIEPGTADAVVLVTYDEGTRR